MKNYYDNPSANVTTRAHATYEGVRAFKEGEAVVCFGDTTADVKVYFSNPGHAKAMRVSRFMSLPPPTETMLRHVGDITKLRDLMVKKGWTAAKADVDSSVPEELVGAINGFKAGQTHFRNPIDAAIVAVAGAYAAINPVDLNGPPATIIPASAIPAPEPEREMTVSAAPPPPLVAERPASAVAEPVKSTAPIAGGSPFSGFAKTPGSSPSVPVQASPEAAQPSASTAKVTTLNKDIEKILEEAAIEARDNLIKSDAAE